MSQTLGDLHGVAAALCGLGAVQYAGGDLPAAEALYEESLALFRDVGVRVGTANALFGLGNVAVARGDHATAHAAYAECLDIYRDIGNGEGIAYLLEALADLAAPVQPERAVRLAGAISRLWNELDTTLLPNHQTTYEQREAAVRGVMGDEAWRRAWAAGRTMTLDQAVADALDALDAAKGATDPAVRSPTAPLETPMPPAGRGCSPLTPRECEVVALVARGYTNRAIAAALVIAERTATNHVAHILTKLGCHTRAQVAVWAAAHDLLPVDAAPDDRPV